MGLTFCRLGDLASMQVSLILFLFLILFFLVSLSLGYFDYPMMALMLSSLWDPPVGLAFDDFLFGGSAFLEIELSTDDSTIKLSIRLMAMQQSTLLIS